MNCVYCTDKHWDPFLTSTALLLPKLLLHFTEQLLKLKPWELFTIVLRYSFQKDVIFGINYHQQARKAPWTNSFKNRSRQDKIMANYQRPGQCLRSFDTEIRLIWKDIKESTFESESRTCAWLRSNKEELPYVFIEYRFQSVRVPTADRLRTL